MTSDVGSPEQARPSARHPNGATRFDLPLSALAALAVLGATLIGLSRFGIWDPWELASADKARQLIADQLPSDTPRTLSLRLVAAGFSVFGTHEWAGRLPIALCGIGLLAVTWFYVRRLADARTATYAALALGTTPFFLLHARLLLGGTPGFLASAIIFGSAACAVFTRNTQEDSTASPGDARSVYGWLALCALGCVLGAMSTGLLLTALPALGAVAVVALFAGESPRSAASKHARRIVIATASLLAIGVVRAVLRHEAGYSVWLGGIPNDGSVPSYDRTIEQLFHAFAPWSALMPVALGALLRIDVQPREPLRLLCVAWASLGYAAQTLFLSSYGTAVFPAAPALAIAAAFWLRDHEDARRSFWPEATLALLLLGLVIRDYALYPGSPLAGLVLGDTKLPATFNPRTPWILALVAFGVGLCLSSMATPRDDAGANTPGVDLQAPYRGIRRLFRSSWGHKAWLLLSALGLLGLFVFGLLSRIPGVPLTSLARRVAKIVGLLPIALPLAVAAGQIVFHLSARLAAVRHVPMFLGALGVAGYTCFGFVPALSGQFSPAKLFDAYNRLAADGEPLVQHQVESGAAHYYAKGQIGEIKNRAELIDYLSDGSARKWAAIPSEQLADIDVAFRRKTHRHLFVPSAENSRVTLVVSQPIKGQRDQNPIARFVRSSPPSVQRTVHGKFEDKIELIGYSLEMGGKDHVGAGQVFHVTWVWRALAGNLGTYKVFLHVDAPNQRINGDHEPVDGKYPVRLWDEGDVIVDRQEINVPATARPGRYMLNVGFFRGEARLKVVEGPHDGVDRLQAGEIEVR